jgi:hypothetical protein
MKTNLSALLTGLVMLSGAGIAQAADVVQKNTQSQSKTASAPIVIENTQSNTAFAPTRVTNTQTSKTGDLKTHGPVALTDDQMNKVTAGHFGWLPHYGYYVDYYGYTWLGWHW